MFNLDTSELDALTSSEALLLLNSKFPITILFVLGLVYGVFFVLHLIDKNFGLLVSSLKSGRGKMVILIEMFMLVLSLVFSLVKGLSLIYVLYVLAVILITLPLVITDYTYQYPVQVTNIVAMLGTYLLTVYILTYRSYEMKALGLEIINYEVDYNLLTYAKYALMISIGLNAISKFMGLNFTNYFNAFKSNQLLSYGYLVSIYAVILCMSTTSRHIAYMIILSQIIVFEVLALINAMASKFYKYVQPGDVIGIQRILNPFTFGMKQTVISNHAVMFAVTPVLVNSLILIVLAFVGGIL